MKIKNLEELYLQIKTDQFYFLKFILEAYDGMAILSSSGIRKNLILIRYPKEMRKDVFDLLAELAIKLNPYVKH